MRAKLFVILFLACFKIQAQAVQVKNAIPDAAGFTNYVLSDPFTPGRVYIVGDVSGMHRSDSFGQEFYAINRGFSQLTHLNGASAKASPSKPNLLYYVAGDEGQNGSGGLFRSTDGGLNWALLSSLPRVSGTDNRSHPLLHNNPRVIGNLIEINESSTRTAKATTLPSVRRQIFIATIDQGLLVTTDEGLTFQTVNMSGYQNFDPIISLYLQNTPNTILSRYLYVGVKGQGVWRISLAKSDGAIISQQKLPSAPIDPQEIAGNMQSVVIASGQAGAHISTDYGNIWNSLPIHSALGTTTIKGFWSAVAVRGQGASTEIWLGCQSIDSQNPCSKSLIRSLNNGLTFSSPHIPIVAPLNSIGTSLPYWFIQGYNQTTLQIPFSVFDGSTCKISSIAFDSFNPQIIYVTANSTPWRSHDGGNTFLPMTNGLGATVATAVSFNPHNPNQVLLGMYDWSLVRSNNQLQSVEWIRPVADTRTGRAFAWLQHQSTTTAYMALSLQQNGTSGSTLGGSIYYSEPGLWSFPPTSQAWTELSLLSETDGRTIGVTAGINSNNKRVVLATVGQGSASDRAIFNTHPCMDPSSPKFRCAGIFRWVEGQTGFTKVYSAPNFLMASYDRAPIYWVPGTNRVLALDRRSGLYASYNQGLNFSLVYPLTGNSGSRSGHFAVDPTNINSVLVSTDNGLFKVTLSSQPGNIPIGSGIPLVLAAHQKPGPVTILSNGDYILASPVGSTHPTGLFKSTDKGLTWTDISDNFYKRRALFPSDITSTANKILISLWGNGYIQIDI